MEITIGTEIWYFENSIADIKYNLPSLEHDYVTHVSTYETYHNKIIKTYALKNNPNKLINSFNSIYTNEDEAIKEYNKFLKNKISEKEEEIKRIRTDIKKLKHQIIRENLL